MLPRSPGLSLGDIYFVLFRRKWTIIAFSMIGFLGALLLYLTRPVMYESEAELFISYVSSSKPLSAAGNNNSPDVKPTETYGEGVINTELQILTSLDVAKETAEILKPEKILAKLGGGSDVNLAAAFIQKNLLVENPRRSSIIRIVFKHPDPQLVQPILSQLIESYKAKHARVRKNLGLYDDFLTQQTDLLRTQAKDTDDELRAVRNKAGVISLVETKKELGDQVAKIQQAVLDAQADLAERQATVEQLTKMLNTGVSANPGLTNISSNSSNAPALPPEKIQEYKQLAEQLNTLRSTERELLLQYTAESFRVKPVREQINQAEGRKEKLEQNFPGLLVVKTEELKSNDSTLQPRSDLMTEVTRVAALQAKINALTNQLASITGRQLAVDQAESLITPLQTKKDLEEERYRYYKQKLEQSRIDEALASVKDSNISDVQKPSAPYRSAWVLGKVLGLIAFGGIALGVGMAFFLELYLDRSVRRPSEVDSKLNLPLLLSIPRTRQQSRTKLLNGPSPLALNAPGEPDTAPHQALEPLPSNGSTPPPWHPAHVLRPFYDALRDRLIAFFEANNLTHKPKLIGVTSCGSGSGVSTVASGLAACLSEIGDGNVLLVDMNLQNGAAHPFYKGKPVCGLDDLLDNGKRDTAMVQENLYVVQESANGSKLPRVLPKRFSSLVPKLKASDYDYIIFDMPAVSQISVTARLSGYMDTVLLVVESEKTDAYAVKKAAEMLTESNAKVNVVLNKTRNYLPKWLHQEF